MIWDQPHPPGVKYIAATYVFLRPCRLRIKKQGQEQLIGYGMGEKIKVMEPELSYCIPPSEKRTTVPLEDGGEITEWPEDLCVALEPYSYPIRME
jgi:hypothetical protein